MTANKHLWRHSWRSAAEKNLRLSQICRACSITPEKAGSLIVVAICFAEDADVMFGVNDPETFCGAAVRWHHRKPPP